MNFHPVVLSGNGVRMEPLDYRHTQDLLLAAAYDEIWTYLDEPTPRTVEDVRLLIADALDEQHNGKRLPFAIIDMNNGHAVGSISYIDIRIPDRGVEIGWMWLTPGVWRHLVGLRSAYLLARHAFEDQGAIRVAFKTDKRNTRSQRMIEALGATREGVWRNHRILSDGTRRDSIFYSITDDEWPATGRALAMRFGAASDAATVLAERRRP